MKVWLWRACARSLPWLPPASPAQQLYPLCAADTSGCSIPRAMVPWDRVGSYLIQHARCYSRLPSVHYTPRPQPHSRRCCLGLPRSGSPQRQPPGPCLTCHRSPLRPTLRPDYRHCPSVSRYHQCLCSDLGEYRCALAPSVA